MNLDRAPVVRLENVSKSFSTGEVKVEALRQVDLDIAAGEFIVVLGPSGSGKTTLLNLVGGIDSPTEGEVIVEGMPIGGLGRNELTMHRRTRIGFVFQFFNLIPTLTARENVELVTELVEHPRPVEEVLEGVGLTERANNFPNQLSGGEQQRVAIARALAKDPPILLCDEPTGELDFETGKRILGIIRDGSKREGKTVLLVTHNSAIGRIADRVIRLRSGRILQDTLNRSPLATEELEW